MLKRAIVVGLCGAMWSGCNLLAGIQEGTLAPVDAGGGYDGTSGAGGGGVTAGGRGGGGGGGSVAGGGGGATAGGGGGEGFDGGSDAADAACSSEAGIFAAACDLVKQTGCPSCEKCTTASLDGGSETTVCMSNGTQGTGQSCVMSPDSCAAGNICASPNGVAQCYQFCATDTDCTQPGYPSGSTPEPTNTGRCLDTVYGALQACTDPCNPVTAAGPNGCASGLSCPLATSPDGGVLYTDCTTATSGGGTDGTSCIGGGLGLCADGFACVYSKTSIFACRQVCRANNDLDCTAVSGYTCQSASLYPYPGTASPSNPIFGACCPPSGC